MNLKNVHICSDSLDKSRTIAFNAKAKPFVPHWY
jgi:hypothetical protein